MPCHLLCRISVVAKAPLLEMVLQPSLFLISMCVIQFCKGNENLRSIFKNHFSKFWVVPSIFDLFSSQKSSLSLLRDENFISLNRSNGASKNTSFRTDFSPKKSFFWAKLFLGHMYIFEISMKRRIFLYPIRPTQRKKVFIS